MKQVRADVPLCNWKPTAERRKLLRMLSRGNGSRATALKVVFDEEERMSGEEVADLVVGDH